MPSPPSEVEGVENGEYLLDAFWRLSRFRQGGFNGPEAIQPGTVRDWCAMTGNRLCVEEINVIFEIDAAYRAAWQRETATEQGEG